MTRILACLLLVALAWPASARMVTDSAGRRVEVPETIGRVFAAGPPAAVFLYVLAPETMLGWPRALRPEERPFIAAPYRDLPEHGRLTGRGGEANLERVIAAAPDLILDFGSVRETYVDLADRVQAQTGIPYVLIDGRFEATAEALRLMGAILGVEERAERLARDVEGTLARVDAVLAGVPEAARPRVYLARGPAGLETGTRGSINSEIIERAGGVNVAEAPGRGRIVQASIEQVIVADPEVIVTWDAGFHRRVRADPLWAGIAALRAGRVLLAPTAPFGWIDRPPSINRMMGLRWMAGRLWPERWGGRLRDEIREFYALYYQVALTEAELDTLEAWAGGSPPR
ncbi:iron ABC transporter substrate-binding protein [Paralimibaculum aggregatum]|uniref:Iron ABC transporter substrate-binding protein n=1 Tax=Paralimibaculum aggregatum TaxID=3036245 RepID=A0ABQ6LIM6_9RHOB|nr:iron ABC transporter substrate-binding protein [Limibaculum sp. NKW23]GMG83132.1 iron ABC transporter substrate-binding protein [Limibaculum sp. NKW23]